MVEITLSSVEQVLYSEYVASSTPPSALYVVEASAEDLEHELIFELDHPVCRVHGREGFSVAAGDFPDESRPSSRIERRVMSKVLRRTFDEMGVSLEGHTRNQPPRGRF